MKYLRNLFKNISKPLYIFPVIFAVIQSIQANLEATLQKQAQAKQDLERARTEQKTLLEKNKTLVAQYQAEIRKQNQVIQSADNEMAAIAKAEKTMTEKASSTSSGFKWPVSVKRITSGFGSRKSPGGIGSTNHQGIDIGAGQGAPIYASASGTVIFAGTSGGYARPFSSGRTMCADCAAPSYSM